MARFLFIALCSLVSVDAFAYKTTTFVLNISRETIRNEKPYTVAATPKIIVRYDGSSCFILGADTDYPCYVQWDYSNFGNYPVFSVTDQAAITAFFTKETIWNTPQYRQEFLGIVRRVGLVQFVPNSRNDQFPAEIFIQDLKVKTSDGKTTYVVQ